MLNDNIPQNFENLVGTTLDDTLTGDASANKIYGGKGTDTLKGGNGDDILYGGITAYQTGSGWSDDAAYSSYSGYSGSQGGGLSKSIWYQHYGDGGDDQLFGQDGDDTIYGASGNDTLDGGLGADTLAGGSGIDTFVLRSGDGGNSLSTADKILDFADGTDVIGLDDGLLYSQLTIVQGTGDNANDTIISKGSEYLAILEGISVSSLSEADFTPVDIA